MVPLHCCSAALDGRNVLELFALGTDNALWYNVQAAPSNSATWSGWQSLQGGFISPPQVARDASGALFVFLLGTDSAVWYTKQTSLPALPAPPTWQDWTTLGGGFVSSPHIALDAANRLQVFAVGLDYALWNVGQIVPSISIASSGPWALNWSSLGGGLTSAPAVATNPGPGLLEVFARGNDNALWHIRELTPPPSITWTPWASLAGKLNGAPYAAQNANGHPEILATSTDNALWHLWQAQPPPPFTWSSWATLGGDLTSAVSVQREKSGILSAFAVGSDAAVWQISQTAPNGCWGAWESHGGGLISAPFVAANFDGHLDVFALGNDSAIWHIWESAPNATTWSAWTSLGGQLTAPT